MILTMGALADPIHEQVGVAPDMVAHYQSDADAISRLAVRGLLPEAQVSAARMKLFRRLCDDETLVRRLYDAEALARKEATDE